MPKLKLVLDLVVHALKLAVKPLRFFLSGPAAMTAEDHDENPTQDDACQAQHGGHACLAWGID